MKLFPAIDLYGGKAVRLYKGNYNQMTVYSENPLEVARDFENCGAECIHLVDLEGARDGTTPNLAIVKQIAEQTSLFSEIGGGIRNMETVEAYIKSGVNRVILGTAAVNDPAFLQAAIDRHGEKIAVGVDIKDGFVAIKGWTEKSALNGLEFCKDMQDLGVQTIICTDISKDGAMQGTNHALYKKMAQELNLNVIASGGVSSIADVEKLNALGIYGAIIGKAYYTGAISIKEAVNITK